jgi:hypothetical protein
MTRATRFVTISAVVSVTYLLLLLDVLPVPFVSQQVKDQILPTVRLH